MAGNLIGSERREAVRRDGSNGWFEGDRESEGGERKRGGNVSVIPRGECVTRCHAMPCHATEVVPSAGAPCDRVTRYRAIFRPRSKIRNYEPRRAQPACAMNHPKEVIRARVQTLRDRTAYSRYTRAPICARRYATTRGVGAPALFLAANSFPDACYSRGISLLFTRSITFDEK